MDLLHLTEDIECKDYVQPNHENEHEPFIAVQV